jgi:hypothetical protein
MLVEVVVIEVDVRDLSILRVHIETHGYAVIGVAIPIREFACRELLELHDILGERASLVGEDVVDLAELLVEVTRLNFGWHVLVDVVDPPIPGNEEGLEELHHF